jgi:hypothetical protein
LLQAIMSARGYLHSWSKQDVAAVFLEFWKKGPTASLGQDQQQQDQAEQQGDWQPKRQPFRCCTFLLVACAKNKPTQPVVPAASQAAKVASS